METTRQDMKQLLYGSTDKFGIYQLKETPELDRLQFEGTEALKRLGKYDDVVKPENYLLIYVGELAEFQGKTQMETLEAINDKFNNDHPADFMGHSLSVSDMVILHENGKNSAHYVDRFGFTEIPDFMKEMEGEKGQEIQGNDRETELAFSIADRFISIQETEDGYDYSIIGTDYKEIDGGVYDNPDVTIREALKDIVDDLRSEPDHNGTKGNIGEDDELIPIDYDDLMAKVEDANRIKPQNSVEADFKMKTDELSQNGNKKDQQKSVTGGQEQPTARTSLKARLAEKSAEAAGQEHNAMVKSNHKNNQWEI